MKLQTNAKKSDEHEAEKSKRKQTRRSRVIRSRDSNTRKSDSQFTINDLETSPLNKKSKTVHQSKEIFVKNFNGTFFILTCLSLDRYLELFSKGNNLFNFFPKYIFKYFEFFNIIFDLPKKFSLYKSIKLSAGKYVGHPLIGH